MPPARRVVVVGASAAGCSVVSELTRSGNDLEIALVSEERGLPYDRPPLTKQYLLGLWSEERVALRVDLSHEFITHYIGDPAVALDVDESVVRLASGAVLPYDDVVVATGTHPKRIADLDRDGVFLLRTLTDAKMLRRSLSSAGRVTIVGGGLIGLEVASACRSIGVGVTIVEPDRSSLSRRLGSVVAERLVDRHVQSGVDFVWGSRPISSEPFTRDGALILDDGSVLPPAPVLVAVGSEPTTQWLEGSGLTLTNGVVCDDRGSASPGVWAAGDVACWWHHRYGRQLRLEHRQNATDQGRIVAHNIEGADEAWDAVPYFWTDQVDAKIQVVGLIDGSYPGDLVEGDLESDSFVLAFNAPNAPPAVIGWNAPAQVLKYRRELSFAG